MRPQMVEANKAMNATNQRLSKITFIVVLIFSQLIAI